jgi:5-(carboxyamino)imidazole ribonucleotide mutase
MHIVGDLPGIEPLPHLHRTPSRPIIDANGELHRRAPFAIEGPTSGEPKPWAMETPLVGIIMGSTSDLATMRAAATTLQELDVPFELRVGSAHRTPDLMFRYAAEAAGRGLKAIIAGAGGAAHLPGMVATKTLLPVIGVPVESHALKGLDSLLSIAQMPAGVPVATMAIGGAANAALFAVRILALHDDALRARLDERIARLARDVEATVL